MTELAKIGYGEYAAAERRFMRSPEEWGNLPSTVQASFAAFTDAVASRAIAATRLHDRGDDEEDGEDEISAAYEPADPDSASVPAGELAAFALLLERTEKALTDLQGRLDAEVAQAIAVERERVLTAAEHLKITLTRPGNGPAQRQETEVLPLAALRDLLKPGTSDEAAWTLNTGRPVRWDSAMLPGGWVCAVPAPGRNPSGICGMPVESEPCPEHRDPGWNPS